MEFDLIIDLSNSYFSVISITGIAFFFSLEFDLIGGEEDDIVDMESLVVELLDEEEGDDDDDELDRLLSLLLVGDLNRFRFDPLPVVDELKRMSRGCQEEFFICQYPHPFRDDLCFLDDFDDRLSFEELDKQCACIYTFVSNEPTMAYSTED